MVHSVYTILSLYAAYFVLLFFLQNNTFQIVMLTDGTLSFAIFNYINMDIALGRYMQVFLLSVAVLLA